MPNMFEIADKILDDGLRDYIGDGLRVEIASKSRVWYRHPMQFVYSPNMPPVDNACMYRESDWRTYRIVKPQKAGNGYRDTARTEIRIAGKPGSKARVEAMRAHYDTTTESAFLRSDEEIADSVATLFTLSSRGPITPAKISLENAE
jgi:hypothetical protein